MQRAAVAPTLSSPSSWKQTSLPDADVSRIEPSSVLTAGPCMASRRCTPTGAPAFSSHVLHAMGQDRRTSSPNASSSHKPVGACSEQRGAEEGRVKSRRAVPCRAWRGLHALGAGASIGKAWEQCLDNGQCMWHLSSGRSYSRSCCVVCCMAKGQPLYLLAHASASGLPLQMSAAWNRHRHTRGPVRLSTPVPHAEVAGTCSAQWQRCPP